jgi:hypothetical protein
MSALARDHASVAARARPIAMGRRAPGAPAQRVGDPGQRALNHLARVSAGEVGYSFRPVVAASVEAARRREGVEKCGPGRVARCWTGSPGIGAGRARQGIVRRLRPDLRSHLPTLSRHPRG